MKPEFNTVQEEVQQLIKTHVLPIWSNSLQSHQVFLKKITALQNDLITGSRAARDQQETFTLYLKYKQDLSQTITSYFKNLQEKNTIFPFLEYFTALEKYVEQLPPKVLQIQAVERFTPTSNDSTVKKIRKKLKNISFHVSKLPTKASNLFRQKENKKPITYWKQQVAWQGIILRQFSVTYVKELLPLLDKLSVGITATTQQLWNVDSTFDQAAIDFLGKGEFLSFQNELVTSEILEVEISNVIQQLHNQSLIKQQEISARTQELLDFSGTFELSNSEFTPDEIAQRRKSIENETLKKLVRWNTTFEIMKDDWDVDLEIFSIALDTEIAFLKLIKTVSNRAKNITASFINAENFLNGILTTLTNSQETKQLKKNLQSEIKQIRTSYEAQIAAPLLTTFEKNEVISKIDQFAKIQQKRIASISSRRAIADHVDFLKPNPPSAINYVSPKELITYESWPALLKAIEISKVVVMDILNKIIQEINGLGQVLEFNLESALDLISKDASDTEEDAQVVALEGVQRSKEKLEVAKNQMSTLDTKVAESLREKVDSFNQKVLSFTKNENILNVRLTIAKAKSIEKSKELRQRIKNKVVYAIPLTLTFVRKKYKIGSVYVKNYLSKLGWLPKASEATVASSDFLLEAQRSVEQLPFVYQRLFKSDTLHNENFFTGANRELHQIDSAWKYFENGRYATVLISGEKGAGKSSLVQRYFQKNPSRLSIQIVCIQDTLDTQEVFYKFLTQQFSTAIHSLSEAIDYLNTQPKQVIVLENLQFLYLKKVKGFEVIHLLTELMAQTHLQVFWIVTTSHYAFQFLEKTNQLSESFSHVVSVNNSTDMEMIDAIEKRHRVSGYNLYFEEPPKAYLSKKYEKASPDEKQEMLKTEFYKDLNKIASGNFKIAFMYWLRSVVSVEKSSIHMRSLKTIDLDFVAKSSVPKTHVLNAVLHHEQLTLSQINTITGVDEATTRNVVRSLFENGLLVEDRNYYAVNTLLYRQIINLLKSKNFIH